MKMKPKLAADAGIDEEVEAVLHPVDAEEHEAQRGLVDLRVDNVDDGDGCDADQVAGGDDEEDQR